MRRKKAFRRDRAIPILLAAGVGYLIGSWNAAASHNKEPSSARTAAQIVALRFPQALGEAPVVQEAAYERPSGEGAMVIGDTHLALFEPEPTIPSAVQPAAPQSTAQPAPTEVAALPPASLAPDAAPVASPEPASPESDTSKPDERMSVVRPQPAAAPHLARRPGYVLDNAQLAAIKRRLHLTPDQERMWPAVEAALRNLSVERERETRLGAAAGAIDPDSPQVQDLKSAAIPLLMSFSDEQKDEVRNLAHTMGLDQLASEF
jgi:hypothetical protein